MNVSTTKLNAYCKRVKNSEKKKKKIIEPSVGNLRKTEGKLTDVTTDMIVLLCVLDVIIFDLFFDIDSYGTQSDSWHGRQRNCQ